jgi:hypothetical protein
MDGIDIKQRIKWYYGNPSTRKHLNRVITFKDEKLLSDEKLDKSIWLDMPKDMLVATRQKTTAYKYEVRLENDLVVGWRELE